MTRLEEILSETELLDEVIPIRVTKKMKQDWNAIGDKLTRSKVYLRNDPTRAEMQKIIDQFSELLKQASLPE